MDCRRNSYEEAICRYCAIVNSPNVVILKPREKHK
jgi:hypothetical protein